MDIDQLTNLAKQGESHKLEFKKSTAQLQPAFETVCAFLNGDGGKVLIGVTDKGQLIGQDVSDNTRKEIARELNRIEPAAQANINIDYILIKENKYVICVHVDGGCHAPYVCDGRSFHRNQSTTNRMTQHRYEQLLVNRGQLNHSWEELPASDLTADDLDHDEIRRAVSQGVAVSRVSADAQSDSIEDILRSWNLMKNGKINNAAAVLFAKKVLPRYTQCHIKMGRFKGVDTLGSFIDNQEYFGNAFHILSEANAFTMRHLPIASFFNQESIERIDQPALPALALREALVNAICHRDYANRSSSITLSIFDDRMEVWNNGKLPPELSLSDLRKKHKSMPRNKVISKVFYDRKFFDGWGTGTIKILKLCQENNIPEPEFEEYSSGLAIVFKFRELIGVSSQIQKLKILLSERQKAIVAIIQKEGVANIQAIMKGLVEPPSQRMIQKDLAYLKDHKLLELKGAKKGAFWVLKSRS